ncbi:hypothetical protein DYB32_006341 [Aphanomyces invadans]|uniref:WW domain-containing protein n=1 Tax=Aphanomyces invadans TaxID=157072 RepID=A0A3R6V8S1_9STRA|nr:hypothetical protein DYB32_006341 [Aphanomyces invadans]
MMTWLRGDIGVVSLLVHHGADMAAVDEEGQTVNKSLEIKLNAYKTQLQQLPGISSSVDSTTAPNTSKIANTANLATLTRQVVEKDELIAALKATLDDVARETTQMEKLIVVQMDTIAELKHTSPAGPVPVPLPDGDNESKSTHPDSQQSEGESIPADDGQLHKIDDFDTPLPPGWEMRVTNSGNVYFVHTKSKVTTWVDPRTHPIQVQTTAPGDPTPFPTPTTHYSIEFHEKRHIGIMFQPNFPVDQGAVVHRVLPDTPAALAKQVQPGHQLVAVNGHPIQDAVFKHVMLLLKGGYRPLILTFDRAAEKLKDQAMELIHNGLNYCFDDRALLWRSIVATRTESENLRHDANETIRFLHLRRILLHHDMSSSTLEQTKLVDPYARFKTLVFPETHTSDSNMAAEPTECDVWLIGRRGVIETTEENSDTILYYGAYFEVTDSVHDSPKDGMRWLPCSDHAVEPPPVVQHKRATVDSWIVSGAGVAAVNGIYVLSGKYEGASKYTSIMGLELFRKRFSLETNDFGNVEDMAVSGVTASGEELPLPAKFRAIYNERDFRVMQQIGSWLATQEMKAKTRAEAIKESHRKVHQDTIQKLVMALSGLRLVTVHVIEAIEKWRKHIQLMGRMSTLYTTEADEVKYGWSASITVTTGKLLYKGSNAFHSKAHAHYGGPHAEEKVGHDALAAPTVIVGRYVFLSCGVHFAIESDDKMSNTRKKKSSCIECRTKAVAAADSWSPTYLTQFEVLDMLRLQRAQQVFLHEIQRTNTATESNDASLPSAPIASAQPMDEVAIFRRVQALYWDRCAALRIQHIRPARAFRQPNVWCRLDAGEWANFRVRGKHLRHLLFHKQLYDTGAKTHSNRRVFIQKLRTYMQLGWEQVDRHDMEALLLEAEVLRGDVFQTSVCSVAKQFVLAAIATASRNACSEIEKPAFSTILKLDGEHVVVSWHSLFHASSPLSSGQPCLYCLRQPHQASIHASGFKFQKDQVICCCQAEHSPERVLVRAYNPATSELYRIKLGNDRMRQILRPRVDGRACELKPLPTDRILNYDPKYAKGRRRTCWEPIFEAQAAQCHEKVVEALLQKVTAWRALHTNNLQVKKRTWAAFQKAKAQVERADSALQESVLRTKDAMAFSERAKTSLMGEQPWDDLENANNWKLLVAKRLIAREVADKEAQLELARMEWFHAEMNEASTRACTAEAKVVRFENAAAFAKRVRLRANEFRAMANTAHLMMVTALRTLSGLLALRFTSSLPIRRNLTFLDTKQEHIHVMPSKLHTVVHGRVCHVVIHENWGDLTVQLYEPRSRQFWTCKVPLADTIHALRVSPTKLQHWLLCVRTNRYSDAVFEPILQNIVLCDNAAIFQVRKSAGKIVYRGVRFVRHRYLLVTMREDMWQHLVISAIGLDEKSNVHGDIHLDPSGRRAMFPGLPTPTQAEFLSLMGMLAIEPKPLSIRLQDGSVVASAIHGFNAWVNKSKCECDRSEAGALMISS